MAKTNTGTRTHDGPDIPEWDHERPEDLPGTTPAEKQQLAVSDPDPQPIEAHVVTVSDEAARRAAEYVQKKKYGPSMQQIILWIAEHAVDTQELNAVIMEIMAKRILNATSPDDIIDPLGTLKGADLVDKPMWVEKVMYLESDKVDGFPYFVTLDVRQNDTGELLPVTIGGEKLVPQIAGLHMHDAFPMVIRVQAVSTRSGNTTYELVPPV